MSVFLSNSVYALENYQNYIRDPGQTISPLDGNPTYITTYLQRIDVDKVVNWLESQSSGCYTENNAVVMFQGEEVLDTSYRICDILLNKKTYLSFLRGVKSGSVSLQDVSKVTLGDIHILMNISAGDNVLDSIAISLDGLAPNSWLIAKRTIDRKWVLGIEKTFAGDSPSYSFVRVFVQNNQLIYQQAEIIPYSVLYGDVEEDQLQIMLDRFDINLKKSANRWWKFSSKSFQLRYNGLIKQFNKDLESLNEFRDHVRLMKK